MIRNVRRRNHSRKSSFYVSLILAFGCLCRHTESLSSRSRNAATTQRRADYATARQTRISLGHNNPVTQAKYRDLLEKYPDDATAASHLAATVLTPYYQSEVARRCGSVDLKRFRRFLVRAGYTTHQVGLVLGVLPYDDGTPHRLSFAMSPIYVTPAAAGTLSHDEVNSITQTPIECLIALFLLGATVPRTRLQDLLGPEFLDLAGSLFLLYSSDIDPDKLLATVQIFPVQLRGADPSHPSEESSSTLYIMTDWHPRVLSQTKVADIDSNTNDEAVMYVGPDSIGLVQQFWCNHPPPPMKLEKEDEGGDTDNYVPHGKRILDFCTGSGIQALVGLAMNGKSYATCVDISLRALHFVVANAQLNGMDPSRLQLIEGDLLSDNGQLWILEKDVQGNVCVKRGKEMKLLGWLKSGDKFDVVSANPPFLPVPPNLMVRHGKFSDGGASGEEVLESIVRISRRILRPTGILAVVSEFFLAPTTVADDSTSWTSDSLLDRIEKWWLDVGTNDDGIEANAKPCGFLLTNEFPIDRETYATRRADSREEYDSWMEHLENVNMSRASPGFLFLKNGCVSGELKHRVAPRSPFGSLWTPSNPDATTFTSNALSILYKS